MPDSSPPRVTQTSQSRLFQEFGRALEPAVLTPSLFAVLVGFIRGLVAEGLTTSVPARQGRRLAGKQRDSLETACLFTVAGLPLPCPRRGLCRLIPLLGCLLFLVE